MMLLKPLDLILVQHSNMLKKFFFFLIFFLISLNLYANEKTALFDIDYILNNSIVGKKILTHLDNINKKNISDLKEYEKEISSSEKDLINKKNIISEEEFQKEMIVLNKKIKSFKSKKKTLVKEFNSKKNSEIFKFMKLINPIIENYMGDNKIGILLDKKNVFIANKNNDITMFILDIIDKQIKDFSFN